jgi:hypothetical protein
MRATEFEFRYRFWFIFLLFWVAFAAYAFDPLNAGKALVRALGYGEGSLAFRAVFFLAPC